MTKGQNALLFLLGLLVPVFIAFFQPIPGYLDSDYYYAGGIQLAQGKGFTEPYLWNYLDGASSLPHPSHGYWMPLSSIVAALGMKLTGSTSFTSARIFFLFIAALVPVVTARLAFTFTGRRDLAFTSGLLGIFSIYSAPFVGVTDNFGLYMLFGALYFLHLASLLEDRSRRLDWLALGLLSGLMTLSRSDGLLWLGLSFLFAVRDFKFKPGQVRAAFPALFISLAGFLLIMGPWYLRNFNTYGSFMAPGGSRALWLANYDQTFTYPPALLTLRSFLDLGWRHIFADRAWALTMNLESGFAAHGGIILFPFILLGIYYLRQDARVRLAGLAWLTLFFVMSFLFPFAGARGAFFHAGAALLPVWWSLAPLGLDSMLAALHQRGIGKASNRIVFRAALVMVAIILTAFVVFMRIFTLGWGETDADYPAIETFLVQHGAQTADSVIVRNAPGYYLQTGRSALSIPYGGEGTILEVARQFDASYLVLESEAVLPPLKGLFTDPAQHAHYQYLGEVDGTRIFKLETR